MKFRHWLQLEAAFFRGQGYRKSYDVLKAIYDAHGQELACTFTQINKVGLNPQSRYDTPLGIYFYPASFLLSVKMQPPFAGDSPFIQVCEFTRQDRILQMEPVHTNDADTIAEVLSSQQGVELLKTLPDHEAAIQQAASTQFDIRSNYSVLWLATRILANNNPVRWNTLFRQLGIDGFVDHGTGTIHPNEPTQGVVFDRSALRVIHTLDNVPHQRREKPGNPRGLSWFRGYLKAIPLTGIFGPRFEKRVAEYAIASAYKAFRLWWYTDNETRGRMEAEAKKFVAGCQSVLPRMQEDYREIYQLILKALSYTIYDERRTYKYGGYSIESDVDNLFSMAHQRAETAGTITAPEGEPEDQYSVQFKRPSGKYRWKLEWQTFADYVRLHEAVSVGRFHLSDLNQWQAGQLYQVFKTSYEQSTGAAWDERLFFRRAANWEFYGTPPQPETPSSGFVAVRRQRDGLTKLVGAAGSPMAIARAARQLAQEGTPIWGMMSGDLAAHLKKLGFIEPPPELIRLVSQYVPALGRSISDIGDDGSVAVTVAGGLGTATTHFVANRPYFDWLLRNPMMINSPDHVKTAITQLQ